MKIKNSNLIPYVLIGIAMFSLTMLFTAQIKTVQDNTEILQGKRESELKDDLATLQRRYNDLKEELDVNLEIVKEYKDSSTSNNTLIKSMKEEVDSLSLYAGTSDLVGEGIIIQLKDGDDPIDPEMRSDTLVHDSDILTVVNELKAAGAEAISVNGERIISTSSIRCVGPTVQINYKKIASPFTISAIGNSQYLESSINIKNGIADLLTEIGIQVFVSRESEVYIPKFDGVLKSEFASIKEED